LWRTVLMRRSVPYALFAVGCLLSVAASEYLSKTAAEAVDTRAHAEFLADSDQMRRQIQSGLNSYVEVIRAGAVLLSADNEISGSEFRRFVTGLRLPDRYPGLEGIGFAQCIRARDLNRFLRLLDLDGNRIRVWPANPRAVYCPTLFFDPRIDASKTALGFDVGTDAALAEAMAQARDTGEPTASPRVDGLPVWDAHGGGRVVLFLPVFRSTLSLESQEARRRALIGYVFGPLDAQRLLQAITASPSLAYEVHDGAIATPAALLAGVNVPNASGRFHSAERVQLGGRQWVIALQSLTAPDAASAPVARYTLVAGIALSLMLLLVSRAQVRAWETAARHHVVLQASAEALRESESQARAANLAKDEFLATVSHELRTPLNVVLGWVNMLRRDAVAPGRIPQALEIIERNARQQAQLIDDLLDVSRIVMGQLRLDRHQVAVAPLVATVVESLRPDAEAKGVALRIHTSKDPCNTLGDADRLRQTIWNLVANAIKFTPSGGQAYVELSRRASHIRLTVRDTGVGIDPAFLPHVFERFKQADSTTTRVHTGVGLGLAIARHLVELHGGTIEAHSQGVGHGATFIVELPAAPVETSTMVSSGPATAVASTAPVLAGVRVLVVDDDESTLELLTTALSTTGAHVISAQSARDALRRVTADSPDVIVSDIAMPGEDGYWLIQHVRTLSGARARTPAIALTALARREDRARVLNAGYQLHVAKPVELSELQTHVAALLAEHSGSSRHSAPYTQ
jgi:signal transduction histidine kinase/ActR/RegA family two-component response regulator